VNHLSIRVIRVIRGRLCSWRFHWFAKRQLKLKRERPFGVVGDGVSFYKTLGRLRIDGKEWRVRKIPEVIDDDFLLFRIIQVQAAYVNPVNRSDSGALGCRACGGRRRRD